MSTANGGPNMGRWMVAAVCGLAAFVLARWAMPAHFGTNLLIGLVVAVIVVLGWSLFGQDDAAAATKPQSWTPPPAPAPKSEPVPVVDPRSVAPVAVPPVGASHAAVTPLTVVPAAAPAAAVPAPIMAPVMAPVEVAVAVPKDPVPKDPVPAARPVAVTKSAGAALASPRQGQADDLKQIEGIGPALEKLVNGLGYWHFDQIAAWTEAEIDLVDQKMDRFKGRIRRDRWVAQAKIIVTEGLDVFRERAKTNDY